MDVNDLLRERIFQAAMLKFRGGLWIERMVCISWVNTSLRLLTIRPIAAIDFSELHK